MGGASEKAEPALSWSKGSATAKICRVADNLLRSE
jgi:hypothetical protein